MNKEEAETLALALEDAIPFFKADRESIAGLPAQSPADMGKMLGEAFCVYVEWKEFDSWGLDGLNALAPIARNGITLSVDDLYDDDGMPVDDEADEPDEFFMSTLQAQLAPHNLQLVEICSLEGKIIVAQENPRLVCIRAAEDCRKTVNAALCHLGLALVA